MFGRANFDTASCQDGWVEQAIISLLHKKKVTSKAYKLHLVNELSN